MAFATDIMIFAGLKHNFEVKAIYPETSTVLKSFDNEYDVKAYVVKLVNKLNIFFKRVGLDMWIKTENGELRNLNYAHKIITFQRYSKVYAQATFSVVTGKNSADPAFSEIATLKVFDNEDDAKVYMDLILAMLNGNKKAFECAVKRQEELK